MKKVTFFLIFLCFLGTAVWGQDTFVWIGGGGGQWNTPGSWSPAGPPTANSDVVMTTAVNVTIPADISLNSLTFSGAGWYQVNFNGTVSIGTFTINAPTGSTVNIGGNFTMDVGTFNLTSGELIITSPNSIINIDNLTVGPNGTMPSWSNNPIRVDGDPVFVKDGEIFTDPAGNNPYQPSINRHLVIGAGATAPASVTFHNGTTVNAADFQYIQFSTLSGNVTRSVTGTGMNIVLLNPGTNNNITSATFQTQSGFVDIQGTYSTPNGSLTITPTGGVVYLSGAATLTANSLTIATFVGGNYNLTISGTSAQLGPLSNFGIITISAGVNAVISTISSAAGIVNNGTLDLGDGDIGPSSFANAGTLRLTGISGQTVSQASVSGTVEFYGTGTTLSGIQTFSNLRIIGGTKSMTSPLTISANGSLTIAPGATLNVNEMISMQGNNTWTNNGTFIHGNNTITFTSGTNTINGNNTFNTVDIPTNNITINFANGSTQTINNLHLNSGSIIKAVTSGTGQWTLNGTINTPVSPATLPTIADCNAVTAQNIIPSPQSGARAIDGGNNLNVFAHSNEHTWTGAVSDAWNTAGNWSGNVVPPNNAFIIIPQVAANRYPVLSGTVTCQDMQIGQNAQIDLRGFTLTVTDANGLVNAGTINLFGNAANQVTVNGASPSAIGGTIRYYNVTLTNAAWVFGNTYYNLVVENTVTMAAIASLTVSGTSQIGSNITTNGAAGQTYTGTTTLLSNVSFNAGAANPITFTGAIAGGNFNLGATGSVVTIGTGTSSNLGALSITGNAEFLNSAGATTPPPISAASVSVSGTSLIRTRVNTVGGEQIYNGTVTLNAVTVTAGSRVMQGANVRFMNGVVGNGCYLEVMGNAEFSGNSTNLRRLSVTGTTLLNANITMQATGGTAADDGNITFTGAVTLGNTVTIQGRGTAVSQNGTTVLFSNTINGAQALTIANANAAFGGAAGGTTPPTSINVSAAASTIEINGNITTSGNQTYAGNVTLGGTPATTARTFTGGGAGVSTITFNGTVAGSANTRPLVVNNANVIFNGTIGNLASVNVGPAGTAGTATINANITTTGIQTYNGNVVLGGGAAAAERVLTGTTVTFGVSGGGNTITAPVNGRALRITGAAVFNSEVMTNVSSTVTALTVTGASTINANIRTNTNQTYTGAVTLSRNINLESATAASDIWFGSTVNGAFSLDVSNATATFNGAVGGTTALTTIHVIGTSVINANITTSGFALIHGEDNTTQMYRQSVVLGANVTLTGPQDRNIRIDGTTNGAFALTVNTANVTFDNSVGSSTPLVSLTVTGGNATIMGPAAEVRTTGNQSYGNNLTIRATQPHELRSSAGSFLVTGIISTPNNANITIGASQGITMNNAANAVSGEVTLYNVYGSTAGNIVFRNNSATNTVITLSNTFPNGNINITSVTGSILLNGISSGNIVMIVSAANISFNASVSSTNRLVLEAAGTVSIPGGVAVTTSSNGITCITDASIYINAAALSISGTTGNIVPGTSGRLCVCQIPVNAVTISNTRIPADRICTHYKPLVFGRNIPAEYLPPNNYRVIDIDTDTIESAYQVDGGNYIVLVNVGTIPNNITFTVGDGSPAGAGRIEIRGVYSPTGNITLLPGSGGIHLNGADITVTNNFEMIIGGNDRDLHLVGTAGAISSSITAPNIDLVGVTGNAANNLTLTSNGDVIFRNGINAGTVNNLTVNATSGSIVFRNPTNDINIYTNINTNGNQEYNGSVRLVVPVDFTGPAVTPITRNIWFRNTVGNDGGGVHTLMVTNLNAVFDDTVNNISNLIINSNGTATINANITTVETQNYSGNVILGGAGSRTLTGANIVALGIVSGNSGVTVQASGSSLIMPNTGNTISGNINLSIPQTGTPPGTILFYTSNNITLNAVNNTTNGNVIIQRAGTLEIASLQAPNGNVILGNEPAVRVGAVTQTAPIAVQSLTIRSSAGITLDNPANAVSSLFIGGANADVVFENTAPNLAIAGIESVVNSDVTIKNSADISVVGVDTLVGGILTLESVTGTANAINIGESIWANRLILKANPVNGVITVQGSVAINVSSNNNHDSGPGDGTEAAIYANAFSFIALAGTNGNIYPGTSGEICIDAVNFTHNARIAGDRYCFHGGVPTGMHLIYGENGNNHFSGMTDYFRVDGLKHPTAPYTVTDGFNIYIINADTTWDNLAFITSGTGYIEFRDTNSLMGDNLTLTPGSGGIRFNDSSLTVKEAFNRSIILIGQSAGTANSITAESVNLAAVTRVGTEASDLALSAAVNENIVLGNITNGIINDLTANVSGTGSITISNNITTAGEQHYNGPVIITSNRILTGESVSLGAISGAGFTLTVNGPGTNNGVAVIKGSGNVASLSINGDTVLIDAVINTTATGINQNYQGNVIITGDVALAGGGSNIRFHGNINGTSGEDSNLIISNMNAVNIDGAAGNNEPLTSITIGTFLPSSPVGTITVPQEIITESLSINTTAAVNLPNANNEIAKIAVTSAGNSINIVNKGALEVAGIGGANASTVSIKPTGDITQTGLITGNVILEIDSQGKIDLSHEDNFNSNEVNELHILEAGGDVAFTNNSSVSLNHVSITNAQNYALSFKSMNGDIIVSANIECERLALEAQNGVVAINNDITVHHSHDCNDVPLGEHAAMYVVANTFSGNGTIHLMDTQKTGEVCVYAIHPGYNGIVRDCDGNNTGDNRIHHHMYAERNIIYRYGPVTDPLPANVAPYDHDMDIYIQADNFTGTIVQARAGQTGSVYIIDIYNNTSHPLVNSRYVNFLTDTGGSIQIFGEYYSSNVLGLHPGVGGIHLWDIDRGGAAINANVMLTDPNSVFDSRERRVTLRGATGETYTINAGTISLGAISSENDDPRSLLLNGNAVLEGGVSGLENFTVSGTTIVDGTLSASVTLQAQSISLESTLNVINASTITIDISGEYTQGGDITSSGSFIQTGNGDVTFEANADLIEITANGAAVHFASEVVINSNLTIEMPASAGIVEFASGISDSSYTLILSGGSSTHPLVMSMDTGNLGNVRILSGSHVTLSADKIIRQRNTVTLEIEANNTVLDTTAGSWYLGDTITSPLPSHSFEGSNGQLILRTGARLLCADLNLTSANFSVNNIGKTFIVVRRNAAIASGVIFNTANLPYLVLDMAGNVAQNLSASAGIGSLYIQAGSVTTLLNDLSVSGEVFIDHVSLTSGVLNAGNFNITVSAGLNGTKDSVAAKIGRWRINGGTIAAGGNPVNVMNAFQQASDKSVTFTRYNSSDTNVFFEIIGNTVWQNFICNETTGATIQFSMHPHQHVVLQSFEITGGSGNNSRVRLTRLPVVYDEDGNVEFGNPDWVYYYNNSLHGTPNGSQALARGIPLVPDDPNLKNNSAENIKFWNFSLFNLSGLQIDLVEIYFSHAWNEPIIVETTVNFIPYYEGNHGYFNHNWREDKTFKIIYSFIEDSNGNGRADRIRVQTSVNVYGDFSDGFSVSVEGYSVAGFAFTQDITGNLSDNDSFYIILNEMPYLYDGSPITWRITNNVMPNGSPILYDGRGRTIGRNDGTIFTTFNTIPPRISYTLTLPDRGKTYIQMSQPVAPWSSSGSAGTINANSAMNDVVDPAQRPRGVLIEHTDPDNPGTWTLLPDQPAVLGAFSFEIESDGTVNTVGNLASGSNTFTMQGLWSLAERAIDWSDIDPNFPPPKYPVDWNYSGYLAYTGNDHILELSHNASVPVTNMFVPPFRVLTDQMIIDLLAQNPVTPSSFAGGNDLITRRNTDVLVSIPPAASDSTDYFAWPIWARFNPANPNINIPGLNTAPGSVFWGQLNTDTGIIWEFDGTKYLEARGDIEMQTRFNPLLSGSLNLIWTTNVGAEFRNPIHAAQRGRSTGGLWIPNDISPLYYYYAPPSAVSSPNPGTNPAAGLYNYTFDSTTTGEKIEFVFRIDNSDMIAARLDIPRGGAIPENWYRLVRPFSFDIQDITRARGGVTILNNVINSDIREVTYLRYNLVRPGRVTIQVHTLDGTLVKSIRRNEHREAGEWTDSWDGTNNGGRPVARGMYFIRIVGPDIDDIRKVMVVR